MSSNTSLPVGRQDPQVSPKSLYSAPDSAAFASLRCPRASRVRLQVAPLGEPTRNVAGRRRRPPRSTSLSNPRQVPQARGLVDGQFRGSRPTPNSPRRGTSVSAPASRLNPQTPERVTQASRVAALSGCRRKGWPRLCEGEGAPRNSPGSLWLQLASRRWLSGSVGPGLG